MTKKNPLEGRAIIFEIIPIGTYVRVMAMDVATTTEVFIQGPATAMESVLKNNAMRRLAYVLRKNGVIE